MIPCKNAHPCEVLREVPGRYAAQFMVYPALEPGMILVDRLHVIHATDVADIGGGHRLERNAEVLCGAGD